MRLLRHLPLFVSPLLLGLANLGGAWTLVGPLVFFGVVPLLDHVFGLDTSDPGAPTSRTLRALPLVFVPVHLGLLGFTLLHLTWLAPGGEWLGLVFATGLAGAITILVAHELMHRSSKLETSAAELLMASVTYTHFCVEHVSGHHKNVATPGDPASARLGESLYAFLPRTLVGSWRSAWRIESERRARAGAPWWSHRLVQYVGFQLLVFATIYATLGGLALLAFVAQSLIAVLFLETINYIEHYGLQRKQLPSGAPERVRPEHSWNASHAVSNSMMLQLARHSDHHAFVQRSYAELRHQPDAPQLPWGYATMLLVAPIPPLWFSVMDRRVSGLSPS